MISALHSTIRIRRASRSILRQEFDEHALFVFGRKMTASISMPIRSVGDATASRGPAASCNTRRCRRLPVLHEKTTTSCPCLLSSSAATDSRHRPRAPRRYVFLPAWNVRWQSGVEGGCRVARAYSSEIKRQACGPAFQTSELDYFLTAFSRRRLLSVVGLRLLGLFSHPLSTSRTFLFRFFVSCANATVGQRCHSRESGHQSTVPAADAWMQETDFDRAPLPGARPSIVQS